MILVALGIESDGKKHVRGVREAATENATECTALLADLRDRGLRMDRWRQATSEGGPQRVRRARLRSAARRTRRNVTEQLPDELRLSVRQEMRGAYAAK